MAPNEVRIVDLPAMRVASALGYGTQPENEAVEMIYSFARSHGIEPGAPGWRCFGFNNPNPSPGSPNYGYEMWLVISEEIEADPPIVIKDVPDGKYAVMRFTGLSNIGKTWRELVAWFEDSPYMRPPNWATCLEEVLNPLEPDPERWTFDLYLPIAV